MTRFLCEAKYEYQKWEISFRPLPVRALCLRGSREPAHCVCGIDAIVREPMIRLTHKNTIKTAGNNLRQFSCLLLGMSSWFFIYFSGFFCVQSAFVVVALPSTKWGFLGILRMHIWLGLVRMFGEWFCVIHPQRGGGMMGFYFSIGRDLRFHWPEGVSGGAGDTARWGKCYDIPFPQSDRHSNQLSCHSNRS